jgi:site-specific recombinase XerD
VTSQSILPHLRSPKPRLEERPGDLQQAFGDAIRLRHFSPRTQRAYWSWIKRCLSANQCKHPRELGPAHIEAFLSHLATERNVSASSQNQALAALLFLFRDVLGRDLPEMDQFVRAKRPTQVPVVLSRDEVQKVLGQLPGDYLLIASLL